MPRGPVRKVMPKGGVVFRMKPGAKNIGYEKGPVQNKGGQLVNKVVFNNNKEDLAHSMKMDYLY